MHTITALGGGGWEKEIIHGMYVKVERNFKTFQFLSGHYKLKKKQTNQK